MQQEVAFHFKDCEQLSYRNSFNFHSQHFFKCHRLKLNVGDKLSFPHNIEAPASVFNADINDSDIISVIMRQCTFYLFVKNISPLKNSVNKVGVNSPNIAPTLSCVHLQPVLGIGKCGVIGRPAFPVMLHTKVLVSNVTCHECALLEGCV